MQLDPFLDTRAARLLTFRLKLVCTLKMVLLTLLFSSQGILSAYSWHAPFFQPPVPVVLLFAAGVHRLGAISS